MSKLPQSFVALGQYLGKNNVELVYGGGMQGLMGIVAQSASDAGGQVTGYLPEFFLSCKSNSCMFEVSMIYLESTLFLFSFSAGDTYVPK